MEAEKIAEICAAFVNSGIDESDIGVITPFRNQAALIRRYMADYPGIEVKTIDKYQGSEKDVIVISFSQSRSGILPILQDERRLNVAVTRAKKKLVVVGNLRTLRKSRFIEKLIDWIGERGRIVRV